MKSEGQGLRAVFSWCLFDFGNSAFSTIVVTFVYSAYFARAIVGDNVEGPALWARAVGISGAIVAVISPMAGAVADRGGYRKLLLLLASAGSIATCLFLFGALPGQVAKAMVLFVIANILFETAMVFYNAFLPDLAPPKRIGRISGMGWAAGYVGGVAAMVLALVLLITPDSPVFGISKENGENIRATVVLAAFWFALFGAPLFLFVREDRSRAAAKGEPVVRAALAQLGATFREIRRYRQVVRLLVARLIYNDGLITLFAFGGLYASTSFGFDEKKLIVFGIVLNVAAAAGAFGLGFLDDVLGGKRTILLSVLALVAASLLALFAPTETVLWIAGCLIGAFAGPMQAASRSLMGRFVPPDKKNEFFGFFAFSGKATAFLGPILVGGLTTAFGSLRWGLSVVLVFFVVGAILLLRVDEEEGIVSPR